MKKAKLPAKTASPSVPAEHKEAAKPKYERTPEEQAVIDAHFAKRKENPPPPRLTVANGHISADHPDPKVGLTLIAEAINSRSQPFVEGLFNQLANASASGGKANEQDLNFMISVVASIKPKEEIEAMLGAQMAAVHMASMTFARRLANAETLEQRDSAERTFNKLTRTFAAQVEALKRYRTGGEQKVTVEHVTVNSGGQAIVGNVTRGKVTGGQELTALASANEKPLALPSISEPQPTTTGGIGEHEKNRRQSHEKKALPFPNGSALLSDIETNRETLPITRRARL
jgi:hypothetical protein